MGFTLSSFTLRNFMILFIVNGLLNQQKAVIGALDKNRPNEREHILPYYDSNNHINDEDDHFHEDEFCDCNSQGPWQPLFKASQVDPDSLHDSTNSIDSTTHDQIHNLPSDLHLNSHSGERQAKKHNHMIHLHLIPHIYIPVVHPLSYPAPVNTKHSYDNPDTHSYENTATNNLSAEHVNDASNEHGDDHNTYHENHLPYQDTYHPTETTDHDSDSGHESDESTRYTLPNTHSSHHPESDEESHQYQVREEGSVDPYYATGSNAKSRLLPLNQNIDLNGIFNKMVTKPKFVDRTQYNKKYMNFPMLTRRLRVMKPPPLGQKETWRVNLPSQRPEIKVFPTQSLFDFNSYASFFNYKPTFRSPMIIRRSQKPSIIKPTHVNTKRIDTSGKKN